MMKLKTIKLHSGMPRLSALALCITMVFGCAGPEQGNAKKQQEKAIQTAKAASPESDASVTPLLSKPSVAQETVVSVAEMTTRSRAQIPAKGWVALDYSGPQNLPAFNAGETYENYDENAVKLVAQSPVSTFSVDVDTGSYANVRRMLKQGYLPPAGAVRVEEFINYFDYGYAMPDDIDLPFSITTTLSVSPWDAERHLMRIGLKGYKPEPVWQKGRNLVFLLDVSGSMNQPDKLPLLTRSLTMLSHQLSDKDSVSIVVYAGASGVVLEATPGNEKANIIQALERLQAGGSTNGASGIHLAYQLAEKAYIDDGVNRVILATDGDFNVGVTDHDTLIHLIDSKRDKGIALTTLGFGQGNFNDHLMEQLADAGNGNYAYIDTINEARKVLVDELSATMQIIAKDVKIQVEFNPDQVAEYRLIGYENRQLKTEDFNNDKVDAGDIGAGHTVTALYELTLVDSNSRYHDPLRYQNNKSDSKPENILPGDKSSELAQVKLRYKQPASDTSQRIESLVHIHDIAPFEQQSDDFKFVTAVTGFAHLIQNSQYRGKVTYDWVIEMANATKGADLFGYRSEFAQLVRSAQALQQQRVSNSEEQGVTSGQ